MEDIGVCVYGVAGVIEVIFVGLTGPWGPANHVEVSLGRLVELFILFEAMLLKPVHSPREQVEHVGVLFSVLGGFAESLFGEIDLVGAFTRTIF